jgi:hypothetical protein
VGRKTDSAPERGERVSPNPAIARLHSS